MVRRLILAMFEKFHRLGQLASEYCSKTSTLD